MDLKKEKWINDVLHSLDGVQRTSPSPFLFAKIRDRLSTQPIPVYVPVRVIGLTSVSFVLLLSLNWQVINKAVDSTLTPDQGLKAVVADMQLYPVSAEFYDVWSEQNY